MTNIFTAEEQQKLKDRNERPHLEGEFKYLSSEETSTLLGLPDFRRVASQFQFLSEGSLTVPAGSLILLSEDRRIGSKISLHYCSSDCQLTGTGYYASVDASEYYAFLQDNGWRLTKEDRSDEILGSVFTSLMSSIILAFFGLIFCNALYEFIMGSGLESTETVLRYYLGLYFVLVLVTFGFCHVERKSLDLKRQSSCSTVLSWFEEAQS